MEFRSASSPRTYVLKPTKLSCKMVTLVSLSMLIFITYSSRIPLFPLRSFFLIFRRPLLSFPVPRRQTPRSRPARRSLAHFHRHGPYLSSRLRRYVSHYGCSPPSIRCPLWLRPWHPLRLGLLSPVFPPGQPCLGEGSRLSDEDLGDAYQATSPRQSCG